MYDRRRRALAAVLAFSLLLLPSLSFASGHGPRHSASPVMGPLDLLGHWLARAWSVVSGSERIDRSWQEVGCGIDPNGQPLTCDPPGGKPPGTSAQTVETGGIDPAQ